VAPFPGLRLPPTPYVLAALLAALLATALPAAAQNDGLRGWYLGAHGVRSMEQGPFGTQWGDASRALGIRLEAPGIRGFLPSIEATMATVRGDCRNVSPCPDIDGWTLRAGFSRGDLPRGDDFLAAPYLRGELGVFVAEGETHFSPALRGGLVFRATERIHPRVEVGQARYPNTGGVWEVGLGFRVAVF
jgi:hypothetical protein